MQTYLDQLYKASERERYGALLRLLSNAIGSDNVVSVGLLNEEMIAASKGEHKAQQLQYIALVSGPSTSLLQ